VPGYDAIDRELRRLDESVARVLDAMERRSYLPDAAEPGELFGLEDERATWQSASFPGRDDEDHPFHDALRSGNAAVAALTSDRANGAAAPTGTSGGEGGDEAREAHQQLYDVLVEAKNHIQTARQALDRARRDMS
jgi:hypothetical protein